MSISFRHIGRILNAGSSGGASPGVSEAWTQSPLTTIASTAGNTDSPVLAPIDGILSAAQFNSTTALTADDTNYLTLLLINLGQDGSGTTNMYSTADANTTKATGGSGLVSNTPRNIVLSSTPADLVVVKGDRLIVRYTKTGTLASGNLFTAGTLLTFTPSA